jgi:hypothetical protein
MQFLEGIVRALDGCVGLLEVLTLLVTAAAVYLGVKTSQKQKHVTEKIAHQHSKAPVKKPSWWPFGILLALALLLGALTFFKYTLMP